MQSKWAKLMAGTLLLMMLSGCGAATGWLIGGTVVATAGSLMMTKKLPNDVVAERQTGLDCDTIRGIENNTEICRPKYDDRIKKTETSYCYRSIGNIVCYKEPNPNYVEVGR